MSRGGGSQAVDSEVRDVFRLQEKTPLDGQEEASDPIRRDWDQMGMGRSHTSRSASTSSEERCGLSQILSVSQCPEHDRYGQAGTN